MRALLVVLLILAAIPVGFVALAVLVVGLGMGGFAALPVVLVALPFLIRRRRPARRRR